MPLRHQVAQRLKLRYFRPETRLAFRMDPLSRTLSGMHLRGSLIATIDLRAPWNVDFEQSVGMPIHYIVEGEAWLHGTGAAPLRIAKGDLVAFPRWDRHFLASGLAPGPAVTISEVVRSNGLQRWRQGQWIDEPLTLTVQGAGERTRILSLVVELERGTADLLVLALPKIIRVTQERAALSPWIKPVLSFLAAEEAQRTPGYAVVQSRLAELLFMQIVRFQLLSQPSLEATSLRMLLDPAITRLVVALNDNPGRHWKLADMARLAGLSRSTFAERFSRNAETTPFEYLRALRLDAAAERLKHGEPVKVQAEAAGYATAYSFGKAFRARFEMSPSAYRATFWSGNAERAGWKT